MKNTKNETKSILFMLRTKGSRNKEGKHLYLFLEAERFSSF